MNVFDFDNTIYDGESMLDLFFWYMKHDLSLIRFIPKVLFAAFKYKLGKISFDEAFNKYAPFLEWYIAKLDDIRGDSVRFWDEHMQNIKPFYKDIHTDNDIIVTASFEITMEEICKRLGVSVCIGSQIDERTSKITRLCFRKRKVDAFFEAYPDAHIENFYTDSPKNDKAMIDIAENAYIIKKNKIIKIK